ncbi:sugar (and other) transporter family protein [Serratia marcescens]|nr:sugar (and other) transporter family protein [Serratia marcescens]
MSVEINQAVAQSGRRKFKSLRWWMLALFLLGVTVNYITRNSLGILAPELKTSLNMSTEQYAWVVASFQLAYTVFQPICGWLIDVIGLKMGFLICAGIWAVVCMLHAGAGSWLQLAILRFFMGARRRRPPRPTPRRSPTGSRKRSGRSPPAGRASVSPSAPCWRRRSSSSLTSPSAGRGRSCSPAGWR